MKTDVQSDGLWAEGGVDCGKSGAKGFLDEQGSQSFLHVYEKSPWSCAMVQHAWLRCLYQTSHRIVGLYKISASAAYCILSKCQLCCSWGSFFVFWSGEVEVEDTFEEVEGKLDGSMGGGKGIGMVMGEESVGNDGTPSGQKQKVGSCSCDGGLS